MIQSKKVIFGFVLRAVLLTLTVFLVGIVIWTRGDAASAGNRTTELKGADLWQDVDANLIAARGARQIVPNNFRTVRLNQAALRDLLRRAPLEFSEAARAQETIFSLPLPDGSFQRFRIEESPIMHEKLAARYTEIKTYRGQGIDDPTAVVRFDLTPAGFHGQILRAGTSVYIDPYAKGDTENYISYLKTEFDSPNRMACLVHGRTEKPKREFGEQQIVNNGGTLRTYRLALAATVEYVNFHGGTKAGALAAQVTTMNRVNGIYERDVSIRMILVPNNDAVIYTGDAAADPYTNDDGATMLDENQANLDTVIGTLNYDIGHVFSTGGGGIAALEAPCNATRKAQGVTGNSAPQNDSFDVDYVAHEMGHQWGGDHTFNGSVGSCMPPNRSFVAGVEPGSGITIQAYAGICETQDLAPHSIDTFHVYSLEEIINYSSNPATGASCDAPIAVANTPPNVSTPASFTIPKLTPFKLTASATDAEDAGLTYNWEEYVPGILPSPPDTDVDGLRPIFRSYPSTTNPSRTFPSMQYVLNNANNPPLTIDCGRTLGGQPYPCTTGEALPAIATTRQYQVTVRDNHSGGGGVRSALVNVTIDSVSGPFAVTAPNSNVTWGGGSTQTVTWNAAGTTAAPVNAATVNIRFSSDGGQTFPVLLKANTPNDGTEMVTIPSTTTSTARILVEAANNVFFDVSDTNFAVLPPLAATAALGGRITDANGNGLSKVRVRLYNADSSIDQTVITNPFGFYKFEDIPVGSTYILTPTGKGQTFVPENRAFTHMEEESNLDFSGE
jgi:Metallo-peptidase family M12B Reprolysin-like